jgi:hypothetical protein
VRPSEHADGGRGDKGGNGGKGRSKSRVLSNILIAAGVVLLLVAGRYVGLLRSGSTPSRMPRTRSCRSYATVSDDGSTAPVVDWAG